MKNSKTTKEWFIFGIKYSSALILLLGALWNYGEIAYNIISGTDSATRLFEQKQIELWLKNKECLVEQPEKFETEKKELIEILLCQKTATMLITVISPDIKTRTSTWIELIRAEQGASMFELNAKVKRVKRSSVSVELCRWANKNTFNIARKIDDRCVLEVRRLDTNDNYNVVVNCEKVCK